MWLLLFHYGNLNINATLISSSKVRLCGRDNLDAEPTLLDGTACDRKFVVALTVENGQVLKNLFYS